MGDFFQSACSYIWKDMRTVKKIVSLLFLINVLAGCYNAPRSGGLNKNDEMAVRKMIGDYNTAWLKSDSAAILNLFADTATLIPSGLKPIRGKKDIINFWWPKDGSITNIDKYKITLLEIGGTDDLAYTCENGKLSWSYENGSVKFSKAQESYEVTLFKKGHDGKWKIFKRIWTDLKQ
ncbi:hypothetical protein BH09BAC6_BH09BAC6_27840 [soil metagenome]|jgi:ketosteroid isomerase-like protein